MTTRRAPHPWAVGVIAGMASYVDSAAIVGSGTALVLYQHSIGLEEREIGAISAALTFSIALGALLGGRLGDRLGRRSVFLATMVTIIVGAALLVFGGGFAPLLIGSILVGVGTGADLPVSIATVSEAATDANRGKLIGFTQIMWYAGIIATTAIQIVVGGLGYLGGQALFAHVGIVAVIVFALRLTIPESAAWTEASAERRVGAHTVRAQRSGLRDILTQRIYLVPFLALLGFYALTNLGANTGGQFGTYVAVNVAGIGVSAYSVIALVALPVATLFALWFMRVADGPRRMTYFVVGAVFMVLGFGVPAVFGFSLITIIAGQALGAFGMAFAFEGIMKVWTQESFPTLLRASAQGAIIAVARVAAALLALFTPSLLGTPRLMYGLIALVVAVGCVIGWAGFRGKRINTFDVEQKDIAEARSELRASGVLTDPPGDTPAQGTSIGGRRP
ncbi:MFS transporter [Microbacterium betulae]|uniref:MFS transporter n=1 Tax=Microbacterium betulae TaxID=2981139 RepID=A0AA97FIC6_9MICO|nr:MFS transporter [Microbacterium sp. AB]WOF23756.1 MFS transporter [Microbacterium sp. AB]